MRSSLALVVLAWVVLVALGIAAPPKAPPSPAPPAPPAWKVGSASAVITPTQQMWMAGYAARKKPSEGVAQDLNAKALVIEDASGGRTVFLTLDLIGVRRELRDAIAQYAMEHHKLPPSHLLINASHTHCGPGYTPNPARPETVAYYDRLQKTLQQLIDQAYSKLEPAHMGYARATAGFAMNRRMNYALKPGDVNYKKAPTPDGPVDHAVPVLLATRPDGTPLVYLFGYACHNTTLGSTSLDAKQPRYEFNGDYSGFAQQYLQQAHPGAIAMFMNGCSGDQNPYPRHNQLPGVYPLDLAKHHGQTLAYAVEAAVLAGPRPLSGSIRAELEDVTIPRQKMKPANPKYPVQVVRLGDQLTLAALGSETVVDYSLRLKKEIPSPFVWIAGYSNDYSGYVASRRVAIEGGYEAANDYVPEVEDIICTKVGEMVKKTAETK